ncbi:MAG TPA: hydroxymethylglutaryl-CoA lyase, partial [Psychrobacter sp.]|nr:hydroxymethylglutaryl-CoA lyase [Psychrobacter sp.]
MSHSYPSHVTIVDVSPRDGLQNESMTVPTEVKQALINDLIDARIKKLEVTSFVSPKWVPQMGDNSALLDALAPTRQTDVCYSVL